MVARRKETVVTYLIRDPNSSSVSYKSPEETQATRHDTTMI